MKRNIFSIFISLFLVLSLSACTKPNEEGSDAAKGDEDYDLLIWEDIEKSQGIKEAVEEFEKEHDVKIKIVEKAYAQQNEDLRLDGPAGIGPDIITIPNDQVGTLVTEGLLKEINLSEEEKSIYTESALESQIVDGKLYGFPKATETVVLVYNKDYVDESNLPKDLEEWYEFSKEVREETGNYGFLALWDQMYYAYGVMSGYDSYIFNEDSNGNYDVKDIGLDSEGAVEAVEYMSKFYREELFPAGMVGEQAINVLDSLFSEGKAAAVISGPWNFKPFEEAGIDYGVAELPLLANGEHMRSFIGVKSYNISSYSENADLAEEFLKFLTNEENSKKRFEQTREVPPIKSLIDDEAIVEDEGSQAVAQQSVYGEITPSIPEMNEVWEPIDSALEQIATGNDDFQKVLEDAVIFVKEQIEANHE